MSGASLQVLVLAGGSASRFGSPKQLASVGGVPMLRLVLGRAIALAGPQVTVVLGAHAAAVAPALGQLGVSLVVNRAWEEGLASSIRAGVASLPGSVAGVLLLLADQVGVTGADLQRLVDAWRGNPRAIAAAQYAGRLGVPALFPRSHFAALGELRGEHGARVLLRGGSGPVVAVPMPGAALDIDTREQLAEFIATMPAQAGSLAAGHNGEGQRPDSPAATGQLELEP